MTDTPFELLSYQKSWLEDQSPFKLCVKSRRIGMSWVVGLEVALLSAGIDPVTFAYDPKRGIDWRIGSASEDQARELLGVVAEHLSVLEKNLGVALLSRQPLRQQLVLANGRTVKAYAASGRSMRGAKGGVVLDEFAHAPFSRDIWAAVLPVSRPHIGKTKGYPVRVISSPMSDSADNQFARLALGDEGKRFSKHTIDVHAAIAAGFPEDVSELRELMDPDAFSMEYECSFLSAADRLISEASYDACILDTPPQLPPEARRTAGYDVARKARGDLAAAVTVGFSADDLAYVLKTETARGLDFESQEGWVGRLIEDGASSVTVDGTGMGAAFAERLTKLYPGRVRTFEFTTKSKADLAEALSLRFSKARIRVPRDPDLRRAVLSIKREFSPSGYILYSSPRSRSSGHADAGWALAMALHGGGRAWAPSGDIVWTAGRRDTADMGRYYASKPRHGRCETTCENGVRIETVWPGRTRGSWP